MIDEMTKEDVDNICNYFAVYGLELTPEMTSAITDAKRNLNKDTSDALKMAMAEHMVSSKDAAFHSELSEEEIDRLRGLAEEKLANKQLN